MKPSVTSRCRLGRRALLVASGFAFTACEGSPSVLDPAGPAARRIEGLWWLMFWISVAVFLVVVGFLVVAMRRSKRHLELPQVDKANVPWGDRFIAIAGVFVPAIILGGVYLISLDHMDELSKAGEDTTQTIEVVAHNWWWEARYENGAVTANEIHIPTGERVKVKLSSTDVIHSFWVPQLQVKIDNIPGRETELWLEADEPGRYRGQCAEFCGLQHANMAFFVVAEDPADFEEWLTTEAASTGGFGGLPPTGAEEGEEIFLGSSCAGCHAVRGTEADATLGPDLTHLARREMIAAGSLANTRANLRRFITDPQGVKPGVGMPPAELTDEEIELVLEYLEQLS